MKISITSPIFGLTAGAEVYAEPVDDLLAGGAPGAARLYDQAGTVLGVAHPSRFRVLPETSPAVQYFERVLDLLALYSGVFSASEGPTLLSHPIIVEVSPGRQHSYYVGPFESTRQAQAWMAIAQQVTPWLGRLATKSVADYARAVEVK